MPVYLITGVAGFIGSTLARAVLAKGGKVVGFDNFSTGKRENLAEVRDEIEFHEADLATWMRFIGLAGEWILSFTKPPSLRFQGR